MQINQKKTSQGKQTIIFSIAKKNGKFPSKKFKKSRTDETKTVVCKLRLQAIEGSVKKG
jgi:hypothetical protein